MIFMGNMILDAQEQRTQKINISVQGMVCDFCARGLEKTLGRRPEVKLLNISLEDKTVKIFLKEGATLSDKQIEKVIKGNGLDVLDIERN